MKATTIKLEGPMLHELKKCKPTSMSVSAYVRGLIESELRRRSLAAAATEYQAFLAREPKEQAWLDDWAQADLAEADLAHASRPPKP